MSRGLTRIQHDRHIFLVSLKYLESYEAGIIVLIIHSLYKFVIFIASISVHYSTYNMHNSIDYEAGTPDTNKKAF